MKEFFNANLRGGNLALNQQDHLLKINQRWCRIPQLCPLVNRRVLQFYFATCTVMSCLVSLSKVYENFNIWSKQKDKEDTPVSWMYPPQQQNKCFSSRLIHVLQTIKEYCGCPRQKTPHNLPLCAHAPNKHPASLLAKRGWGRGKIYIFHVNGEKE